MDFIKEKSLACVDTSNVLDAALPSCSVTRRLDDIGVDGVIVENLLSADECARLVQAAEASGGFAFWDPDGGEDKRAVRNADTVEFDDPSLCESLFARLLPSITQTVTFSPDDEETFETELEGEWTATGLNTHLLINRYGGGGHFSPHADGSTLRDFNRRSLFVCQLVSIHRPLGRPLPAASLPALLAHPEVGGSKSRCADCLDIP